MTIYASCFRVVFGISLTFEFLIIIIFSHRIYGTNVCVCFAIEPLIEIQILKTIVMTDNVSNLGSLHIRLLSCQMFYGMLDNLGPYSPVLREKSSTVLDQGPCVGYLNIPFIQNKSKRTGPNCRND